MAAPACLRPAAALGADRELKWVVVTITGTRPATCSSTASHHLLALVVGQHELLGEVGQDADAVGAGVDHEVEAAPLAVEVELAAFVENGGRDGKDAAVRT